jgi:hypothetical protein
VAGRNSLRGYALGIQFPRGKSSESVHISGYADAFQIGFLMEHPARSMSFCLGHSQFTERKTDHTAHAPVPPLPGPHRPTQEPALYTAASPARAARRGSVPLSRESKCGCPQCRRPATVQVPVCDEGVSRIAAGLLGG